MPPVKSSTGSPLVSQGLLPVPQPGSSSMPVNGMPAFQRKAFKGFGFGEKYQSALKFSARHIFPLLQKTLLAGSVVTALGGMLTQSVPLLNSANALLLSSSALCFANLAERLIPGYTKYVAKTVAERFLMAESLGVLSSVASLFLLNTDARYVWAYAMSMFTLMCGVSARNYCSELKFQQVLGEYDAWFHSAMNSIGLGYDDLGTSDEYGHAARLREEVDRARRRILGEDDGPSVYERIADWAKDTVRAHEEAKLKALKKALSILDLSEEDSHNHVKVKKIYRELAFKYHPDHNLLRKTWAEKKFKEATESYKTICQARGWKT